MGDGQREPQSAPEPAPAPTPATASAAALPAAPVSPGRASIADVLRLQRSAGNRLVSRWLARQPAAPTPPPGPPGTAPGASARTPKGLTRDDFEPVSFDPKFIGDNQLEAVPGAGGDTIDLKAPEVVANAKVTMKKPDTAPADPAAPAPPPDKPKSATVGFIQTVLNSERRLRYTEDGTAQGKLGVEIRDAVPPGSRDARSAKGAKAQGGGPVEGSGWAPFYQEPKPVSPDTPTEVAFNDHTTQTGIQLKLKGTDDKLYTLSQVVGGDSFRLSVGAIEPDGPKSPIHLAAKEWRVPWDMTLDASHKAKGGKIDVGKYEGKLEDISPATGWSDRDAQQFRWPQDEAEAEKLDTSSLVKGIPFAQRWDVNAWMMMCKVLRARNPSCSIKINLKEQPDIYSQIGVTIRGPRTATRSAREWFSGEQTFGFRMLDLLDPQDLAVGLTLQVEFTRDGGTVNTVPWTWPFNAISPVRVTWAKGASGDEEARGTMSDTARRGATGVTTEMIVSGTALA